MGDTRAPVRYPQGVRAPLTSLGNSVVVLLPKVCNQRLTHQPAQSVLQLHGLNEQIVLRVELGRSHRRLEVEAQPFLNAPQSRALREVQEQHQVQYNGRRQNRIATQKVHLDLHRVAKPSENVDIVPTFLVVAAWRIVVDPYLMVNLLVQIGVKIRLKNEFKRAELRFFLGLDRTRIFEHFAVAISQNIGG